MVFQQILATMHNELKHDGGKTCHSLYKQCEMFHKVPDDKIDILAKNTTYRIFNKNENLLTEGQDSDRFFLLESGEIRRKREDPTTGKIHNVEFEIQAKSVNSMTIFSEGQVWATTKCTSDECRVFEMKRDTFLKVLQKHPDIATGIAAGLAAELRKGSRKYATPMFETQQQEINAPFVAIAAGIESYYRSALNAMLNARLTGVKADWFPNMHVQVPTRIGYIVGLKGLRAAFNEHIDADQFSYPTAVRVGEAIAPGIVMTPISSVLEASNAGHMNSESMTTRWMRGAFPRMGREIIFGIGLNQMTDYFEERVQPAFGGDGVMANAMGSLIAGVVSGYLSHVPHNLSTFKLMQPHLSYGELYSQFVDRSVPAIVDRGVAKWPETPRGIARYTLATLFPRGVMIRTVQIVGSFIILNGTINFLQVRERLKIQRAVSGNAWGYMSIEDGS